MSRVDDERREDREDVPPEVPPGGLLPFLLELFPRDDGDPRGREPREEVLVEAGRLLGLHREDSLPHERQLVARREPVVRPLREVGRELVAQSGDPDHEELVEVALGDAEELQPLQERPPLVARLLEDPRVEVEPGELAVQEGRERRPLGNGTVLLGRGRVVFRRLGRRVLVRGGRLEEQGIGLDEDVGVPLPARALLVADHASRSFVPQAGAPTAWRSAPASSPAIDSTVSFSVPSTMTRARSSVPE